VSLQNLGLSSRYALLCKLTLTLTTYQPTVLGKVDLNKRIHLIIAIKVMCFCIIFFALAVLFIDALGIVTCLFLAQERSLFGTHH
jgi:hypothetical protein